MTQIGTVELPRCVLTYEGAVSECGGHALCGGLNLDNCKLVDVFQDTSAFRLSRDDWPSHLILNNPMWREDWYTTLLQYSSRMTYGSICFRVLNTVNSTWLSFLLTKDGLFCHNITAPRKKRCRESRLPIEMDSERKHIPTYTMLVQFRQDIEDTRLRFVFQVRFYFLFILQKKTMWQRDN